MQASLIRRTLPKSIFILAAVLVGLVTAGKDATNVDAFVSPNFGPSGTASVTSNATNAVTDIALTLTIPGAIGSPNTGDYNFGSVSFFVPKEAKIHPSGGGDTPPALGDIVANIHSEANLGLTNNPCNPAGVLSLDFMMFNSTVSTADVINPAPQTTTDPRGVLGILRDDDDGDTVVEASDTNGLPNYVDHWPSYDTTLFPGVTPKARYAGSLKVAGDTAVVLQFLIFDLPPNGLNQLAVPNGANDLGNDKLGYPATVVLQDPTQPAAPNDITDFCSPLVTNNDLYGFAKANPCVVTPGSCTTEAAINGPTPGSATTRVRYRNPPSAGTYRYPLVVGSQRDSDGDGLENQFDTCPKNATPLYNPRDTFAADTQDPDDDMLPSTSLGGCDDQDGVKETNTDSDAGTLKPWLNALDNCPLVSNPTNLESETSQADNIATPRGGPQGDGMGDACDLAEGPGAQCTDTSDNDSDGLVNDGCVGVNNPTVGSAESGAACTNGLFLDEDSDGAPNDGCTGADAIEVGCLNSTDDDGDGTVNDGCASSDKVSDGAYYVEMDDNPVCIGETDTDGDGWCNSTETTYGSSTSLNTSTPENYDFYIPFPVAHSGAGSPPLGRQPLQACNDGVDNDGNGGMDAEEDDGTDAGDREDCAPPQPVPLTTDSDGDGTRNEAEIFMGTDPMGRCGAKGGTGPSNAWAADLAGSDDKIDVLDLSTYVGTPRRLNTAPGNADHNARFDAVPGPAASGGNWIDVSDIQAVFQLAPAMPPYSGAAAFQNFGKICTSDPVLND